MIIFATGTDTYRLRAAVQTVAAGGRVVTVDAADDADRIELERTLKYPSFFQEKISVVVRNILADAEVAADVHRILDRYGVPILADITVIACQEQSGTRESSASKALTTYLKKHASTVEIFAPLTGTALTQWISQYCAARQSSIDPQASALLARRTGGESWVLANELEKLCAYAGGEPIIVAMMDLLANISYAHDDFAISNALAAGNKRNALGALYRSLKGGAPDQQILGLLAYSVRTLLSRNGSDPKLHQAHAGLATLDRNIKDGRAFGEDGLFSLVLDM